MTLWRTGISFTSGKRRPPVAGGGNLVWVGVLRVTGMEPDQGVEMSLVIAKRLAEMKEEIASLDNEVADKYKGFRAKIREEVKNEFITYMQEQGFQIQNISGVIAASYKGLIVSLNFGIDPVMGSFDNFDILVDGKTHLVLMAVTFAGEKRLPTSSGSDPLQLLQQRIEALKFTNDNLNLESYSYVYVPAGSRHSASTLPELLDIVLAVK
ncbi:hypothetical protein MYA83_12455 [Pseudomonas palleroniana]|uniref:hypothetical protein n=1 Tax=Pseudomonas palleroniana TaxID=191390 RepID=UPI003AFF7152